MTGVTRAEAAPLPYRPDACRTTGLLCALTPMCPGAPDSVDATPSKWRLGGGPCAASTAPPLVGCTAHAWRAALPPDSAAVGGHGTRAAARSPKPGRAGLHRRPGRRVVVANVAPRLPKAVSRQLSVSRHGRA